MTDKEVHKLSRRELLALLLAQVGETEELKHLLEERDRQLTALHDNYERLRKRLDQKDNTIHELRDTMRRERTARRIELQEAGSIAEAALRLNGIFEQAQKAADQYLENVRRLAGASEEGEESPAADQSPAGGRSPAADQSPAGERNPAADQSPAGGRNPAADQSPADQGSPAGRRSPIGCRNPILPAE